MNLDRLAEDLAVFATLLREPLDRIDGSKISFALWDVRAIVSNERLIDIETDAYLLRSSKSSKRPPYARDVARMLADATSWSKDLAGAFPLLDADGPTFLAADLSKKPLKQFLKVANGNIIRMKWSGDMQVATHATSPKGTVITNEAELIHRADWLLVSDPDDAAWLEQSGY